MPLNDLKKPSRSSYYKCTFGDRRSILSACGGMWNGFFLHTRGGEPWPDLAIWEISSAVSVRPASTGFDESNPNFEVPHPIVYDIKGFKAEWNKIARRKDIDAETIEAEQGALIESRRNQLMSAIIKSFELKSRQREFAEWNPEGRSFSILVTDKDKGLHASEFRLLWRNDKGLSLRQVQNRVRKVAGKPLPEEKATPTRSATFREKWSEHKKNERKKVEKYRKQANAIVDKRRPALRRKFAQLALNESHALPKGARFQAPQQFLLSLDDGNQTYRVLAPTIDTEVLVDIQAKYTWSNFDEADNRLWEYRYALLDPTFKKIGKNFGTFWAKLNRAQKTFYSFLAFDGDINNGGVWQFLFNSPELSLAALEALYEIGAADKLIKDYETTLRTGGKCRHGRRLTTTIQRQEPELPEAMVGLCERLQQPSLGSANPKLLLHGEIQTPAVSQDVQLHRIGIRLLREFPQRRLMARRPAICKMPAHRAYFFP